MIRYLYNLFFYNEIKPILGRWGVPYEKKFKNKFYDNCLKS